MKKFVLIDPINNSLLAVVSAESKEALIKEIEGFSEIRKAHTKNVVEITEKINPYENFSEFYQEMVRLGNIEHEFRGKKIRTGVLIRLCSARIEPLENYEY